MSILRSKLRSRVIVTLKSGASFEGLFFREDRESIELRQASALAAADDRSDVSLDGDLILMKFDVDFIQRP